MACDAALLSLEIRINNKIELHPKCNVQKERKEKDKENTKQKDKKHSERVEKWQKW